ncbi:hypothetical protein IW262DRAFT_1300343 [Armillaria fumosa]|nr:hypothetical protein IW262DRAFT_1300343 [Armillaria fumosa]
MTDGPVQQIFLLAEDKEDAMKIFAHDYYLARQKGGRALGAMQCHLWSHWRWKFPLTLIQLCGCHSTKDDEAYLQDDMLSVHSYQCIESYLNHLSAMIHAIRPSEGNLTAEVINVEVADGVGSASEDTHNISTSNPPTCRMPCQSPQLQELCQRFALLTPAYSLGNIPIPAITASWVQDLPAVHKDHRGYETLQWLEDGNRSGPAFICLGYISSLLSMFSFNIPACYQLWTSLPLMALNYLWRCLGATLWAYGRYTLHVQLDQTVTKGVFECLTSRATSLHFSHCKILAMPSSKLPYTLPKYLKPFAKEYGSSDPGLWPDVPRGTLSDLDAMGMSLWDLLAANDAYLHLESAAMPLAVEYTTSFVQNSYIINEIIAETLVSHPALPPNCTVDDDEGREPFRALVLVTSKHSRNQWVHHFPESYLGINVFGSLRIRNSLYA